MARFDRSGGKRLKETEEYPMGFGKSVALRHAFGKDRGAHNCGYCCFPPHSWFLSLCSRFAGSPSLLLGLPIQLFGLYIANTLGFSRFLSVCFMFVLMHTASYCFKDVKKSELKSTLKVAEEKVLTDLKASVGECFWNRNHEYHDKRDDRIL